MKTKSILVLAAAWASASAMAQTAAPTATPEPASTLSFNISAVSDYRFRGMSQTSFKPAVQAGLDYAHKSGMYAGVWGSNVNWIKDYIGAKDGNLEVDLYAGYKGEIAKNLGFDIGLITYQYPSNTASTVTVNADTTEVYGALTYGIFTAKYSHSTSNFIANTNSVGSRYVELAANLDLGNGLTLTPHIGRQTIPNQVDNAGDCNDLSLTLAKDFGNGLAASVAVFTSDAKDSFYKVSGFDNLGKNGLNVGVKYTF